MQGASETIQKHTQTSSCASKVCRILKSHVLIISTVTAAFLGFGFGFAIRQAHPSQNALIWIGKSYNLLGPIAMEFSIEFYRVR